MKPMGHIIILLSLCAIFAGNVMSDVSSDDNLMAKAKKLGPEYEKLLMMVKEKRAPIQTIDGELNIAQHPGVGPKDASVILIEFGDFQCPFCRRHLLGTAQELYENLVLTNQIRYVFFDYPMEAKHPLAAKAAAAARCAEEQAKYWEMRNTLYTSQKALHEGFLSKHAKMSGLNEAEFTSCLESDRYESAVMQDKAIGMSLGVKGTPTFFIGINKGDEVMLVRKIQGLQSYDVFEQEIFATIDGIQAQHETTVHTGLAGY